MFSSCLVLDEISPKCTLKNNVHDMGIVENIS